MARRGRDEAHEASDWRTFYRRVQGGPDAALPRVRLFAMMLGEDGDAVEQRAVAALSAGDQSGYDAELLRLTGKLLERIHEF
jgi:hypothetical protein